VQIEQLACCEPAGIGLEMTHWSTKNSGEDSGRTGNSSKDSALYSLLGLEDSGSATPSQSVLENANLE